MKRTPWHKKGKRDGKNGKSLNGASNCSGEIDTKGFLANGPAAPSRDRGKGNEY